MTVCFCGQLLTCPVQTLTKVLSDFILLQNHYLNKNRQHSIGEKHDDGVDNSENVFV